MTASHQLPRVISNISIPRPPRYGWLRRACAWRLTAQGYFKRCAIFALSAAPHKFCLLQWLFEQVDVWCRPNQWSNCARLAFFSCCLSEQLVPRYLKWLFYFFYLATTSQRAAMSQFSTMTTREKKMQAAAICREIHGPEGTWMQHLLLTLFHVSFHIRFHFLPIFSLHIVRFLSLKEQVWSFGVMLSSYN